LVFFSPIIEFDRCEKVFGNILSVSDTFSVYNDTKIGTMNSGCQPNESPGSPILFISQSFECGLNGGSYGGRGGIGLGGNVSNTIQCIQNSFSRMASYGDPFKPIHSGSTGSPFSLDQKSVKRRCKHFRKKYRLLLGT
jgi:hypothetical protein